MQLFSISPFYVFFTLILPIFLSLSYILSLPFSFPVSFGISLLLSLCLSCFHHFFSNHKLEHSFLIFKLIAIDGDKTSYVSFEKLRSGILFQIGQSLEVVRDFAKGEERCDRSDVQLVNSSEKKGFEVILNSLFCIDLIWNSEEIFDAYYNVLIDNCQQTVSKLLKCVAKESLDLQFHIPGSEDTTTIDGDKIISFVEKLFPKWTQNVVQQFPEIPDPFAFVTKN